jgi:hypoxanthine phosphoribosyltransferase
VTLGDASLELLYDAPTIAGTVRRMAAEIARDYGAEPLLLVGVLRGALFVTVDLARSLGKATGHPDAIAVDFITTSSYGNAARSSGEVRLLKDTSERVAGRHVLVVEDIVDNGLTLDYLRKLLGGRRPASLRTCVLLDKPYERRVAVPIDYRGLIAPNTFIVGYGLDYQERYRNLPYLAQLRPPVT